MLDAVLSTKLGAALFATPAIFVTRFGARFRWPAQTFQDRSALRESHVDQTLACLGEYGVPLGRRISIDAGDFTVFDVVRDCALNFDPSGDELDWTAIALIHYLPPMRAWKTRFGVVHRFDDLARSLADRRQFLRSSCGGSHRFHALVYLLRAHERHAILSDARARLVRRRVRTLRERAIAAQRPDGSWDRRWHEPTATRASSGVERGSAGGHLVLTGHLGEVLLTLPDDLAVADDVLRRAAKWSWERLQAATPKELASRLCPWTHVACLVKQVQRGAAR